FAPYFTQVTIAPNPASHSSQVSYTVTAFVVCSVQCAVANAVAVDVSELQAGTTTYYMTCPGSPWSVGSCSWLSTSVVSPVLKTPSSAGSYYIFVTVKDSVGRSDTVAVLLTVT
ncbi:MAG: hypothetical protein L3J93_05680, partial [Thermoplasmata archaeon]|nr:hypothetical protein [Thermoplasmata archaeon]